LSASDTGDGRSFRRGARGERCEVRGEAGEEGRRGRRTDPVKGQGGEVSVEAEGRRGENARRTEMVERIAVRK
jgi:hypothetical protein